MGISTQNNNHDTMSRNLGGHGINHIFICFYDGGDSLLTKSCDIIKNNQNKNFQEFKDFQVVTKTEEEKELVKNAFDVFVKNTKNKRVTIGIFCHGLENRVCGMEFKSFYETFLEPIRKAAEQLLIGDHSCYSKAHEKSYENYTDVSSVVPKLEIYVSSACEIQ